MSSYFGEYGVYSVAALVLAGLWVKPLGILWLISLCLARRKGDPARVGVTWIKVVYPFWIIASIGYVVVFGLRIWYYIYLDNDTFTSNYIYYVRQAEDHIAVTAELFTGLADIFLFISFVELSNGFLLCLSNGAQFMPRRKQLRYVILGWGFVLFALVLSTFALGHSVTARSYDMQRSSRSNVNEAQLLLDLLHGIRLDGACRILFWITSLGMVALASQAVHKLRENPALRKTAVLLLVATILDSVRLLVRMAIYAHNTLQNPERYIFRGSMAPIEALLIVDPFFNYLFMFILLVLLFTLGARKQGGLWSQAQQGWGMPTGFVTTAPASGPPMVPITSSSNGLPAYLAVAQQKQQQDMAWQQQQHQQQDMAWQQQQQYRQQQQQQQYPQNQQQQYPQGQYYYPPQQQQQFSNPESGMVANGFQAPSPPVEGYGQK